MKDFKLILKEYQQKINNQLELFFKQKIDQTKDISPHVLEMMQHLEEFTLRGGKRIRPILLIFGYKCINKTTTDKYYNEELVNEENEIIKAAMAVELMESFLLIHDDIIDNDDLRRGKPTLHRIYEKNTTLNNKKEIPDDKKHFGKSMAIIGGDILAVLGSEILLSTNFSDQNKIETLNIFNKTIINTCFGEMLDVYSEFEQGLTEDDINKIHLLKTAKYTIEAPLHIGAIFAGANNVQLKTLSDYALNLGRAFQIQDDILGVFGNEQKLGKPVGSDLKEGKKTLLIIKALENCSDNDKSFILKNLGNKDLSLNDLEKFKEIIINTGSLGYSKNLANELAEKAKQTIINSDFNDVGKDFLINLADYIVNRKY